MQKKRQAVIDKEAQADIKASSRNQGKRETFVSRSGSNTFYLSQAYIMQLKAIISTVPAKLSQGTKPLLRSSYPKSSNNYIGSQKMRSEWLASNALFQMMF